MKHLIFLTTIFIIISCTSCNNSNANTENSKATAAPGNTASSPSSGDAVFSYSLDGEKISGGDVDELQTNNIASVTQSSDNSNELSFFLNDTYKENTETVSHSLRFSIPGKTGAVTLTPDAAKWNVELFLPTNVEGKYVVYGNEAFNITVTNISAARVSGTFSGKVKAVVGQGAAKDEFTITDGKFDIPVRNIK